MVGKRSSLLHNTLMLYLLTASGYLLSILSVPYQTRILGPEVYGELMVAQVWAGYAQMVVEFGFLLSATEAVAASREDREKLSRLQSEILVGKVILCIGVLAVVSGAWLLVPAVRRDGRLYLMAVLAGIANGLLPDYLYRGMEKMGTMTLRAVLIRLLFTGAVFLFLKRPEQSWMIPGFQALGGLAGCAWGYWDGYRRFGVGFGKVSPGSVFRTLRRSGGYFLSRTAATAYGAANTLVLGAVYPGAAVPGLYATAEKLVGTARSVFAPIADSLYPYMVAHRDFRLARRLLLVVMPLTALGCAIIAPAAEPLCGALFGEEFRESGDMLRRLLPLVVMAFPVYLLGYPILTPLGKAGLANLSVVIGAAVHGLQLGGLALLGRLTPENLCTAACVTEFAVLAVRGMAAALALGRKTGGL